MCVEIVMMILMMMISAKEKRYTTCVGAHKVTKRYAKKKISLPLCPLPHETTSNQQQFYHIFSTGGDQKKKRVKKKKGKRGKATPSSSTFGLKAWDSKTKSEKKNAFFLLLPSSLYY
tara:strand:+ start:3485 stop:3835 length:351 start_codon:yes stop_codon:yes gene_type:complete